MIISYLLLGLAVSAPPAGDAPVKVTIAVMHVSPDRWRVDYTFGRPVSGLSRRGALYPGADLFYSCRHDGAR